MAHVTAEDRYDPQEVLILDPESLDPTKHYRFVRNDPQNIARKKVQGYRVVSRKEDKVKTLTELESTDDSIQLNDLILMCCHKSTHQARQSRLKGVSQGRLEAAKQKLQEKVDRASASGLNIRVTDKLSDKGEISDGED